MADQHNGGAPGGTRRISLGAAFLMATSAIGPGFLTHTAVFTEKLWASFGFVILVSIILDLGVQLNIWRIIAVTGKGGPDVCNAVKPGLGSFLALAVVFGGAAFNIGNIAGTSLGLQALFGLSLPAGALISAAIAIAVFLVPETGKAMDKVTSYLGVLMILLALYVALISKPPIGNVLLETLRPKTIDVLAIITLVGGTVGGYISFAGGHRLLAAGLIGREALPEVTRSSVTGITIVSLMRILLFLAVLGVLTSGAKLSPTNPLGSVFEYALGGLGYKMFGLILWSASITSVIGAVFTSVSFLRSLSPWFSQYETAVRIAFIAVTTLAFIVLGEPVKLLILAGALNAFILPFAIGVMLIAAHRKALVGDDYTHPPLLTFFGLAALLATAYLALVTLGGLCTQFV